MQLEPASRNIPSIIHFAASRTPAKSLACSSIDFSPTTGTGSNRVQDLCRPAGPSKGKWENLCWCDRTHKLVPIRTWVSFVRTGRSPCSQVITLDRRWRHRLQQPHHPLWHSRWPRQWTSTADTTTHQYRSHLSWNRLVSAKLVMGGLEMLVPVRQGMGG